jgi:hypothetical protein
VGGAKTKTKNKNKIKPCSPPLQTYEALNEVD